MKDNNIKNYSNSYLLTELESRLATFTSQEIQTLSRILAQNYSSLSFALTSALQQERLKQKALLGSLTPTEREQVDEFLKKHGFKKND
jgi:hypothetical protein